MEKVVEPEAKRHFTFGRYGRKEAAAQDDDVCAWQAKECAIGQDKLSQRLVLCGRLVRRREGYRECQASWNDTLHDLPGTKSTARNWLSCRAKKAR